MGDIMLRNGSRASMDKVRETIGALSKLRHEDVLLFTEFVYYCREPKPMCFGGQKQQLSALGLADDNGNVDDVVRNIVLSSIEGEEMKQVMPF